MHFHRSSSSTGGLMLLLVALLCLLVGAAAQGGGGSGGGYRAGERLLFADEFDELDNEVWEVRPDTHTSQRSAAETATAGPTGR